MSQADLDAAIENVASVAQVQGLIDSHTADASAHHAPTTDAGDLTTGTLDVGRLPIDVVFSDELADAIDQHAAIADAHHALASGSIDTHVSDPNAHNAAISAAVTAAINAHNTSATPHQAAISDASRLTAGTVPVGRLPSSVVLATELTGTESEPSGAAGQQVTNTFSPINLPDSTAVELARVTVSPTVSTNVALTGHAYIEKRCTSGSRFEVTLQRGSCSGTVLGSALWRAGTSSSTFCADTISLTGFASGVGSNTVMVLCGRAFDADPGTVYMRGIVATW